MAVEIEHHQGRNLLFGSVSVTSGTTQLVGAQSDNQKIKVCSYALVADAAATVKFSDGSDLTGAMSFAANGGIAAAGQASSPWFTTGKALALSIVTTGGAIRGHLSYVVEP
jgi:hypothetical protein